MIYQREIIPLLESELDKKETTVITGMRQVGKTTLLNHLYSKIVSQNKAIFDFENPLHRKIFEEENYDAIWNNLTVFGVTNKEKSYILLDEIQNLPVISSVTKYLNDHYDVKFIVTGSSSYYLKNLFPESQSGRKLIFEVFPLTFHEFLGFKGIEKERINSFLGKAKQKNNIAYGKYISYYREYMEYGGFPRVVKEENRERKQMLLNEVFTSYFEKDVKTLTDIKDSSIIRDLILLLVPRVGSKIEIGKIASALSVSRETIYNYLALLEQTYFISFLSKFTSSIDRQAAGTKKLFLCDGGVANFLGKLSEGQLFEQSIFQNLNKSHKLNYFSNDQGGEIDFIVDSKVAIEVKLNPSRQDIEFLKRRNNVLNTTECYIASLEYSDEKEAILATDF
jgi:predicted AAA+ superfamily ATPase